MLFDGKITGSGVMKGSDVDTLGAAQTFTACFLYPGVAHYDNDVTMRRVLIDKHIKGIAEAFVGAPVTINHPTPSDLPMGDPKIVGRVTNVFLNHEGFITKEGVQIPADNKYYCDFYVTTPEAIEACKQLGAISCAWESIEWIKPERDENGQLEKLTYIDGEYDAELKSARAQHMAIVDSPRYEQSTIYKNSNMPAEIKETTSSIELEKGVHLSWVSSAADKARNLLSATFLNAKKSKKNEDSYDDDEQEESEKENGKKVKNAKKKNESPEEKEEGEVEEEKNSKKAKKKNESDKDEKENESDKDEKENESDKDEKENESDEEKLTKENAMDVDGEMVSHEELKNSWRNAKKANETKTNASTKKTSDDSEGGVLANARNALPAAGLSEPYVKGDKLFS